MNYLDQKGVKEYNECMGSGMIWVSGCCLRKLVWNHYAELKTAGKCYEWVIYQSL